MKGSGNAEVAVLGAGPAGAVAARLLAEWGHRVVLLHRTAARPGIAESLPPSLGKLLAVVGAGPAVEAAGFYRSRGNTVWWEGDHPRVEPFAAGAQGYQVLRPHLDTLLQTLAHGAGAELWQHVLVRAAHPAVGAGARGLVEYQSPSGTGALEVDWILDATGRTALVSRALGFRQPEPGQRTLAVIGVWHSATGWPLPDETHTLVEAYAQGWAWSVPLSPTERHVAVMVDPRAGGQARGAGRPVTEIYAAELARTAQLRQLTQRGALVAPPSAHDASAYSSARAAGPGFLLVGDAASFVDPLSSYGVKKALASAWLGAVVTHTALTRPAMAGVALDFYADRERVMYESLRRLTAAQFDRVASGAREHPFWRDRAEAVAAEELWRPEAAHGALAAPSSAVQAALAGLKASAFIRLARTTRWQVVSQPAVQDREIVLEQRLALAGNRAARYVRGVDLLGLGALVHTATQVPDLFEAYNRAHRPVALPDFLAVLAALVAQEYLVQETGPPV